VVCEQGKRLWDAATPASDADLSFSSLLTAAFTASRPCSRCVGKLALPMRLKTAPVVSDLERAPGQGMACSELINYKSLMPGRYSTHRCFRRR
jgi:hypothetical protein